MKVTERAIVDLITKKTSIDETQFGFVPERSTTGAIFQVRQLQKYLSKIKLLYFTFVNMGKAFDKVSHSLIW